MPANHQQLIGVSYQHLLSANLRTQSAVESSLKSSDHPTFPKENHLFSAEASSLTFDDKKHFNMSYHETSSGSQDGSNGTIQVAQFHPEPGFTIFVDDSSPRESKSDEPDTSVTSDICRKLDFSERKPEDIDTKKAMQHSDTQRPSRREVNTKTGFQQDGSISSNKLLNAEVISPRPHLAKKRLPPHVAENNIDFTKRSTVSNSEAPKVIAYEHATGDGSLSFFSEDLDVNSAAAISVAALKDAIQKAQEIIQIAKKLMERKKGGLQSDLNQVVKDGLRVKVIKQNPIAREENRTDDINAKDTCENVDSLLNVFSWRWKSVSRRGQDDLYFRTSTLGKVTNAQNHATNDKHEPALSTILNIGNNRTVSPDLQVVMHKRENGVGERNVTRETQEVFVKKEGPNKNAHEQGFIKKNVHAVVMDNELEESAGKVAKDVEIENPLVSQEDGDCEKIEMEYKQKIEDEMKFESLVLKDSDYEKVTCKTQKQDHNKQKVNFQQHSEKTKANMKEEPPRTICDEVMEERYEDAFEWVQNEDESKDSLGNESNVNEKKDTYMTEVIWSERRLAEVNNLTIEEKTTTNFHGRKKCEEKYGKCELKGSENCFGSCHNNEKMENEKVTCKTQKQDHNKQKVNFQQHSEKTKANMKEEPPRTICDEVMEERYEDAFEWVQNEDESKDSLGNESNVNEKKDTYMTEVIWSERRLAEVNNLTIEEKTTTNFHGRKKCEEKYGKCELKGSENCFGSCHNNEKMENIQTGPRKLEALQQADYVSTVDIERDPLSHDATTNIIETQGACQPFMFDESSKAKPQVNDKSGSVDKATKEFCDFREGEEEEAKVISKRHNILFETVRLVEGDTEESEYTKMTNLFEVNSSEGNIPGFGLTDSDLKNKEAKKRNKDFETNINPDNGAQKSVTVSIEKPPVFKEDEIFRDDKAVKSSPDVSNVEGRHVAILKNFEASPGPISSSEIEKVVQADEEMRGRHSTQMNGDSFRKTIEEEEGNTKADTEMETEMVVDVNVDNPKEEFALKETETAKAVSKGVAENEYKRKICEESKREIQREKNRIAVETAIKEARDRAFAGARERAERAERAAVERATAEVQQRMMAEVRGKLEKATIAAKPPAEKALVDAKIRLERAAVERAAAEARARALEKALSQKTTRNTSMEDLRKSDETYIESAQRSKARLEREERIMERSAKALAEKNMRDLLAQKEEAEKNRLAESLDAEIRRWSTGKEGNLRALLSTLQYILAPGSGWQPISLTDIIISNAVKKAYRKATLHVHPDKLQQRGASMREKYICEKVFDLLKAAWNRFSSEER
ncbi:hypothetical protein POM88_045181 [Heracleum sosnowskyi]|uniref:J domain-containing protein n=1 Tax=Heracleum sosnowskyi TaxID=360622 RepID=A0AAD8M5X8_9APIA|nr:hypothetical protein POM88_045181 [Heracleum sosnowskyi]